VVLWCCCCGGVVLLWWCGAVVLLLCCAVVVLVCWCASVLVCWCAVVVFVLLCCCAVVWWCGGVVVLLHSTLYGSSTGTSHKYFFTPSNIFISLRSASSASSASFACSLQSLGLRTGPNQCGGEIDCVGRQHQCRRAQHTHDPVAFGGQHHARDGLAARVGERQSKLILHDNYLFCPLLFLTIVIFVHYYFLSIQYF
jgi:hypothetical protein